MPPSEPRALAPERIVAGAARLSWGLPLLAMAVIGFSERGEELLGMPRDALVTLAEIAAVLGVALGAGALLGTGRTSVQTAVRRQAVLGTAGSVAIVLVTQIGAISGALSGRSAELQLGTALKAATRDYPGWNGGARLADGAAVHIVEIDAASDFAKIALKQYGRPYRIALLGADNRAGTRELTLGLEGARTVRGNGALGSAVREAETARRTEGTPPPRLLPPSVLHIAPGERHEGAIVLFPPEESFREARAIELGVNGHHVRVPGRFFSLDEKRAIDAARSAPKSP